MIRFRDYLRVYDCIRITFAAVGIVGMVIWFLVTSVRAEDGPRYPCPSTESCKIITLTLQEEKFMMTQNGVLDTAAQARQLDLGQFVVFMKQKIAGAPAGEIVKVQDKPTNNKSDRAVDNPK